MVIANRATGITEETTMIAFQFGGMALMALFFGALVTSDRREISR
jgi:hypothetical protein